MYSSGDMNLKGVFVVLFILAFLGLVTAVGGGFWLIWWLMTHVSVSFV